MIVAKCTCGARYKVPADYAGRKVRCKKCGTVFRAPARNEPEFPLGVGPALVESALSGASAPPADPTPVGVSAASAQRHPLPRIRPRAGFWADVLWTTLFVINPKNLILFIIVWILSIAAMFVGFVPLVGWVISLIISMYIIAWYVSIIAETASGEDDLPGFPSGGGFLDDILKPVLAYIGTFVLLMLPAFCYGMFMLGMLQSRGMTDPTNWNLIDWLTSAGPGGAPLLLLTAAGIFLWPITLMCVSMGGLGALFRIDMILVAVARTILPYLAIFLMVSAATALPGIIMAAAGSASGPAQSSAGGRVLTWVVAPAVEVYFSVVTMRLLGLYYLHFKERFPWDWE